jgi:NAD-dependent deacetylase
VAALDEIAQWILGAARVAALCGAGISTESGIPDFRGPQGVWTRDPKAERLSTLDAYMTDQDVRVQAWQLRLQHPAWTAEPNAGHLALAELEARGLLHALVTQNIDGLHQKAGTSEDILVEIHGTMREVVCMSCGERAAMERALQRVRDGEEDPPCRTCGGILKSATISFGQSLEEEDVAKAMREAAACDLFLAIGSSLVVYPVAYLPRIALDSGARVVVMNAEPTPYDAVASAVLREPIGEILPELVRRVTSRSAC